MIDDDVTYESGQTLEAWVQANVNDWADYYDQNFRKKHERYRRTFNGEYNVSDKERDSERSKIVSPATQQAVESSCAEVEEATFGTGVIFDINDDVGDKDDADIVYLRTKLHEDLERNNVRKDLGECIFNAAIDGTGIAEIELCTIKEQKPSTRDAGGGMTAIGVEVGDRVAVKIRPIQRRNFRIDPAATCIDEALGVAIEEFVPLHSVEAKMEDGTFIDQDIRPAASDDDIVANPSLSNYPTDNTVKLTRYYGLVPTALLKKAQDEELDEGEEWMSIEVDDESTYTEAIVVIANDGLLLKAEANLYMMSDRPVVAFQWDVQSSQFDGRGVCEKAFNSQNALDTEIRARIDALALTVHPMLAMDANAVPRGAKPQVKPGQTILTNGRPQDTLMPFNFGTVDQITFSQAAQMERMVQQSTGAVDSVGFAEQANAGNGTAAGISMSLGAVLKRHKRTLINFQQGMLIPAIRKIAWRYMQFDPEHYPIRDYKFVVNSTLGLVGREYVMTQLVQLLQTMPPESPAYNAVLMAVVDNSQVSNREELKGLLEQAGQPTEEQQQAQQMEQQKAMELHQAQVAVLEAQAAESNARATKYNEEARWAETEAKAALMRAAPLNRDDEVDDSKEFERRLAIADRSLKAREIGIKEQAGRVDAAVKLRQMLNQEEG